MPQIVRSLGWSAALAIAACCCRQTSGADYPEAVPVPPRVQTEDGFAPRAGAQQFSQDEAALAAPPEPSAELRPTSQKLSGHQRPIPLAPRSSEAQPGLRSGDVPPLVTAAASLGIVLGLFLLVVWVVRRGMPRNVALLPREAVEVLGRAPLVGRQQVHLVRCGNKILLLSVSPGGVETLSEITDPVEVDRLAGICQQVNPNSASSSFRNVFRQFEKPPRPSDFLPGRPEDDLDFDGLDVAGRSRTQESRT